MLWDEMGGGLVGAEMVSIFAFLLGGTKKLSRVRFDMVKR